MLRRFQNEKCGGLAEKQTGAVEIKRAAAVGARGLKAIEADEDKFGQCLKAAGKDAVSDAGGNQIGGVADGVGSAGAGVGEDDGVSGKTERLLDVEDLLLWQIA